VKGTKRKRNKNFTGTSSEPETTTQRVKATKRKRKRNENFTGMQGVDLEFAACFSGTMKQPIKP